MQLIEKISSRLKRYAALSLALGILLSGLGTSVFDSIAMATPGEVTSRSIQMSNATPSASGVSYLVSFTPATVSQTIGGIIVDFCTSPILGITCTAPTFLGIGTPTCTGISPPTGFSTSSGTWNCTKFGGSSTTTLELSNATQQTTAVTAVAITFTITTMVNPSASCASNVCTFYARIMTFDTQAHAASYSPTGANTGEDDQGGVAITTVSQLTINSKVQEQIQFCIDTNSAATCSAATTGAIALGDTNDILTTAGAYTSIIPQYIIQTNAQHNVSISVQGPTLTGGFSGSATIKTSSANAAGAAVNTSYGSAPATSQFGFCSWESTGATLTPVAPYANAS